MDYNRAEQLQLLLELTVESINELALTVDHGHLSPLELFQLAVSQGIEQFQFVTRKPTKQLSIGKVDTKTVAFQLQDKELTAAILHGPADWLDDTDFDTLGGEEPYRYDNED